MTEAAKRISDGSYGIQIPNKYDDEMGQLVDNINQMSLQISQSEKMQTEFISSVSHELRTPLTAINGWGETLLADDGRRRPAAAPGRATSSCQESRRLTNMVEELLEFSKHRRTAASPCRVEHDGPSGGVGGRRLHLSGAFPPGGHRSGAIPTAGGDVRQPITGDPERLRQVFCNLLDNAAKHGGSGKRIDRRPCGRRETTMRSSRIRDYGPGIPEEELPYVKQKFYKGSSKARGSGIGLAVCDEIIQRHEGTFDIGNAPGGGCVVTIRLPISA